MTRYSIEPRKKCKYRKQLLDTGLDTLKLLPKR